MSSKDKSWKSPLLVLKLCAVVLIGIIFIYIYILSTKDLRQGQNQSRVVDLNQTLQQSLNEGPLGDSAFKSFSLLEAENLHIKNQFKKVNLVSLWATWCPSCKTELPQMDLLFKKWKKNNFQIISINLDLPKEEEQVKNFWKKNKISFPVFFDPQKIWAKSLKAEVLPSHFLINEKGQILLRIDGKTNWNDTNVQSLITDQF